MSEVNVISRVQMIVVNPTTRSVSVINMGPQGPGGPPGVDGAEGPPGADGADGATGPPGPGVPTGGSAGQILSKVDGTDYNTQWSSQVAAQPLDQQLSELAALVPAYNQEQLPFFQASGSGMALTALTSAAKTLLDDPSINAMRTTLGVPPTNRSINTTAPLSGGGDLSADRTLTVVTFGSAVAGVVPASGGGTTKFLRADGTWQVPSASGTGLPPGGTIYNLLVKASSTDGDAVWSSVPQVASLTADTIAIRDVVGTSFPRLSFGTGDGNNGTNPNPYDYTLQLIGGKLSVVSSLNIAKDIVSFLRTATNKVEFGLQDWFMTDDGDNYLRFFSGADRAQAEAWLDNVGNFGARGIITAAGVESSYEIKAASHFTAGYLQSPAGQALNLRAQGTDTSKILIQTNNTSLNALQTSGDWQNRALVLNNGGGSGTGCGITLHTGVQAVANAMQNWSNEFGFVNGANTGYVPLRGGAYNTVSSRSIKRDICSIEDGLAAVEAIQPISYRDISATWAQKTDGSGPVVPEAPPRMGFVVEDIEPVLPDLVTSAGIRDIEGAELKGFELTGMIAVLWQAVRELTVRLKELEGASL